MCAFIYLLELSADLMDTSQIISAAFDFYTATTRDRNSFKYRFLINTARTKTELLDQSQNDGNGSLLPILSGCLLDQMGQFELAN